MSQSLSQEDLNNQLIRRIKELEQTVEGLRTNQNQVQEVRIQGHPQHTDRWTQSNSYVDVEGSIRQINFDKYKRFKWRFEMVGYVDGGTGFWQLYNVTDGAVIAGSEISTSSTASALVITGELPKPSGTKTIKVQHKQTGGSSSDFVNSVMSNHLFSFD